MYGHCIRCGNLITSSLGCDYCGRLVTQIVRTGFDSYQEARSGEELDSLTQQYGNPDSQIASIINSFVRRQDTDNSTDGDDECSCPEINGIKIHRPYCPKR